MEWETYLLVKADGREPIVVGCLCEMNQVLEQMPNKHCYGIDRAKYTQENQLFIVEEIL